MKSLRAPWKCRAMETVENQRQVSHCSHSAWKSLSRFPHSHRAGGAWKSAKPKPGFALSHLLSCFLSSHTGSALCDHAIQMGLLAAISVTHVAGLKCYPCPRPYITHCKYRSVFLSRAREQAFFGIFSQTRQQGDVCSTHSLSGEVWGRLVSVWPGPTRLRARHGRQRRTPLIRTGSISPGRQSGPNARRQAKPACRDSRAKPRHPSRPTPA
jgi:hypothetical protein